MTNARCAPLLLVALFACAPEPPAEHPRLAQAEEPECIRYWAEARYRYPGYDHVVTVDNACVARAYCQVSTNVDPDPVLVVVEPASHAEVLVRRGSPSADFTPRVVCEIEGPAKAPPGSIASRTVDDPAP
jgi:hypothetical protein